jgi:hypothetical protein
MATVHTGWIADKNRWNLECPPNWFLTGLTNYDAQLVLIPSRKRAQYLLCRRRSLTAGLGDVAMVDNQHPDTNMCYAYGVLPIAPLRWTKTNTDVGMFTQANLSSLIETLKARDAWEAGGGPLAHDPDAVWKTMEAAEAAQEAKDDRALWEKFYHMGRDGWRSLTARTGARNKRASDYHGAARAPKVTSGGVILTDK